MGTAMTSRDYVGTSLRVFHDTMSPDDITAQLARAPTFTGFKGAQRGTSRAPGSVATWSENYWSSDFNEGDTVEDRLTAVIDFLTMREQEMAGLLRSGGRSDIYVFLAPNQTLGIEVGPSLLHVLGRIGVGLGIEFSPCSRARDGLE